MRLCGLIIKFVCMANFLAFCDALQSGACALFQSVWSIFARTNLIGRGRKPRATDLDYRLLNQTPHDFEKVALVEIAFDNIGTGAGIEAAFAVFFSVAARH